MPDLRFNERDADAIRKVIHSEVQPVKETVDATHAELLALKEVIRGTDQHPEVGLVWRVKDLEDWRHDITALLNRLFLLMSPIAVAALLGAIGFVWGLVTGHVTILAK